MFRRKNRTFAFRMNDIASELERLHTLTGAEFSRQVERIALRGEFHPLAGETAIYTVGGEQQGDYANLLNAARKAVEHGFRVFVLPNPKGIRTADFIFEQRGIYKMYDLKTIQGNASVGNRLKESVGQSNRVLLNMKSDYSARVLVRDVKFYFERFPSAYEVLVFKGKKMISVKRNMVAKKDFVKEFRRMYEK